MCRRKAGSVSKNSFVLYHDMRGPLELLNDEERGRLFSAIFAYSEEGIEPTFTGSLQLAFAFVKTALDRDAAAWEKTVEERRKAGRKGGKQRAANQAKATFASRKEANQATQAVTVTVPVPVPDTVPVPDRESNPADKPPRFIPPSLEEVTAYCQERGNTVDPQAFVDFYAAKGWKIGNQKMVDWKAAVRTWEGKGRKQRSTVPTDADYETGW